MKTRPTAQIHTVGGTTAIGATVADRDGPQSGAMVAFGGPSIGGIPPEAGTAPHRNVAAAQSLCRVLAHKAQLHSQVHRQ